MGGSLEGFCGGITAPGGGRGRARRAGLPMGPGICCGLTRGALPSPRLSGSLQLPGCTVCIQKLRFEPLLPGGTPTAQGPWGLLSLHNRPTCHSLAWPGCLPMGGLASPPPTATGRLLLSQPRLPHYLPESQSSRTFPPTGGASVSLPLTWTGLCDHLDEQSRQRDAVSVSGSSYDKVPQVAA